MRTVSRFLNWIICCLLLICVVSIPVSANDSKTIACPYSENISLPTSNRTVYSFTPDETQQYVFSLENIINASYGMNPYIEITDSVSGNMVQMDSVMDTTYTTVFVTMEANTEYRIQVNYYGNQPMENATFRLDYVAEMTGISIAQDTLTCYHFPDSFTGSDSIFRIFTQVLPIQARGEIVWTSSKPDILAVKDPGDEATQGQGLFLALKAGTSVVTATCGDFSDSVTVTVENLPTLTVNEPKTDTCVYNYGKYYEFTAPKAGTYIFSVESDVLLYYYIDSRGEFDSENRIVRPMEQGETCCLNVEGINSASHQMTYTITVKQDDPCENSHDYDENHKCRRCGTIGGTCGEDLKWEFEEITGTLKISGSGAMSNYMETAAPWYAFREEIRDVSLPNGISTIGDGALEGCSNLESITIPDGITSIGSMAFAACSNLASIIIPDSVTEIKGGVFFFCEKLESVTLPRGITAIGNTLFYRCSKLASITIPDGVTSIGNESFSQCTSLASISIPDSVTFIDEGAFLSCSSLTSISIPDGVTSIGPEAFAGCSGINTITIPGSVEELGYGAFINCTGLQSVTFAGDAPEFLLLTSLGEYAEESHTFYNVTATAYYPVNSDTWTSDVMEDYGGTITWVPYGETESETEIAVVIPGVDNAGIVVTPPANGWKTGTNTFTVSCENPCVVAVSYDNGATYTCLNAAGTDGDYSFTAEDMTSETIIAVTLYGDTNGDGKITNADITKLKAVVGKRTDISALARCAADVNKSDTITNADITKLKAVVGKRTQLGW